MTARTIAQREGVRRSHVRICGDRDGDGRGRWPANQRPEASGQRLRPRPLACDLPARQRRGRSGDALHCEHVPGSRQASRPGGFFRTVLEGTAASVEGRRRLRPARGRTRRSVAEVDAASRRQAATSFQADRPRLGRPLYPAQQWSDPIPREWPGALCLLRHRPEGVTSNTRRGGGAPRQSPDCAAWLTRQTRFFRWSEVRSPAMSVWGES